VTHDQITLEDLVRSPITSDFKRVDMTDEIVSHLSPNEEYRVMVSHCHEATMMNNLCLFSLVNKDNEILERFEPYWMPMGAPVVWSSDSTKLLVIARIPVSFTDKSYVYDTAIIYDIPEGTFCWMKIGLYYDKEFCIKSPGVLVIKDTKMNPDTSSGGDKEVNLGNLTQYLSPNLGIIRNELKREVEKKQREAETNNNPGIIGTFLKTWSGLAKRF